MESISISNLQIIYNVTRYMKLFQLFQRFHLKINNNWFFLSCRVIFHLIFFETYVTPKVTAKRQLFLR